jgi:error-prone DNA polymerase
MKVSPLFEPCLAPLVFAWDFWMSGPRYAELQCTSHFSFLRGASSCEELFAEAAQLGIEALAITDRNSLAGIVRAHQAAKATGVRLIVGCRLDLIDGMSVLVYPTDRPAYARLCRLLSLGKNAAARRNAGSIGPMSSPMARA